jgi:hypothetical protein
MVEKKNMFINKHDKIAYVLSVIVALIVIVMFGLSLINQVGKDSDLVTNPTEVEDGIVSVSSDFDKKKIPFGKKTLILPEGYLVSSKIKVQSGETFDCASSSQCDVFFISDGDLTKYYFSNQSSLTLVNQFAENIEPESFSVDGKAIKLQIEKNYLYDFDADDNPIKLDTYTYASVTGCLNEEKTLCFTTDYLPIEPTENTIEVQKLRDFLNNLRFE